MQLDRVELHYFVVMIYNQFDGCAVGIPAPPYVIQSIYGGASARIVRSGSICVYMMKELFFCVCMYMDGGWL